MRKKGVEGGSESGLTSEDVRVLHQSLRSVQLEAAMAREFSGRVMVSEGIVESARVSVKAGIGEVVGSQTEELELGGSIGYGYKGREAEIFMRGQMYAYRHLWRALFPDQDINTYIDESRDLSRRVMNSMREGVISG